MDALCERTAAGLHVSISAIKHLGKVELACEMDGKAAYQLVPLEKALDAFYHPAMYLTSDQIEALGLR